MRANSKLKFNGSYETLQNAVLELLDKDVFSDDDLKLIMKMSTLEPGSQFSVDKAPDHIWTFMAKYQSWSPFKDLVKSQATEE